MGMRSILAHVSPLNVRSTMLLRYIVLSLLILLIIGCTKKDDRESSTGRHEISKSDTVYIDSLAKQNHISKTDAEHLKSIHAISKLIMLDDSLKCYCSLNWNDNTDGISITIGLSPRHEVDLYVNYILSDDGSTDIKIPIAQSNGRLLTSKANKFHEILKSKYRLYRMTITEGYYTRSNIEVRYSDTKGNDEQIIHIVSLKDLFGDYKKDLTRRSS